MSRPTAASSGPLLARPLRFLVVFSLLTGPLLYAWAGASTHYLAAIAALANAILGATGCPVTLNAPTGASGEVVHPGTVGALALFAATPGRPWRWMARWALVTLAVLVCLHVLLLVAATWQAWAHAAPAAGADLYLLPLVSRLVNGSRDWAPLLAVVVIWFSALRASTPPMDSTA